jgi:DNA sulfur modification protein DndD
MIINKIILKNFGIFFGLHEIDIKPQKNKPVILFGALNGSGKTTLLEGIQIALYGKSAQIDFRGKKNYYEYLKSLINNQANPKDGASIELEFEFNMNSKNEIFNLKRSWYLVNEIIEEKSTINNKNIFSGEKRDNVNEFIEDLMPSNISNLFFFDGEKIETLAEPLKSKKIIQDGIYSLLGIHDINDLIKSLQIYEKKKFNEYKVLEKEDVKILDAEIIKKEDEIEDLVQTKSNEKHREDKNKRDLKENTDELEKNGFNLFKKREEIKKENIHLQEISQIKKAQLIELSTEKLGLLLVKKQIKEIRDSLIESSGFNTSNMSLLEEEFSKLDRSLEGDSKKSVTSYISKRLEELKNKINDMPYDIDESLIPSEEFFDDIEKSCKSLLSEFEEIHDKLIINEKKLIAIPEEEKLKPLIEKEILLVQEKNDIDNLIKVIDIQIEALSKELVSLNKEKDKLTREYAEKIIESDKAKIRISKSEKSRNSLEKYKQKLLEKNRIKIADLITQSFTKLQRKEDRKLIFHIDIKDFSLKVMEDNDEIDVSGLSAGEKQMIAISILWALTQASNKIFPSLIDTPLARLDSHHRSNIIKNYFPKTSKQVLIFSTDEEIYGKHYNELQKNVAHEYLIEFDSTKNSSEFKKGYFQEDLFA